MDRAGVLKSLIARVVLKMGGHKYRLMAVIILLFMLFGALLGIFEEIVPLVPFMISLFEELAAAYSQILLLDMHTGYGPRYQMSIVNSNQEPRSSPELARAFNYQAVSKTNPEEFYAIKGDMIDYFYSLVEDHYPGLRFYAAAFEFGTLGESLPAQIRSIKALVNEKRLHHYGAVSARAEKKARHDYNEQYYPVETKWRETVLKDARQAFEGILQSEGFIEKT